MWSWLGASSFKRTVQADVVGPAGTADEQPQEALDVGHRTDAARLQVHQL